MGMTEPMDISEVYETLKPKVMGYIYGKLGNNPDAEDLCSEVFMKVCSHMDGFDAEKSSLSTWVYTVTRNTVYDYFRTRHMSAELDESMPTNDDMDRDLCRDETLEELADALERLPEREKNLIVLHYYGGETLKEIADRLDLSYSHTKALHVQALKHLQKLMEKNVPFSFSLV